MSNHLKFPQDEDGYFTLQLPQPSVFQHALPVWMPGRRRLVTLLKSLNKRKLAFYAVIATGGFGLLLIISFFVPSSLRFSVAGDTCGFNPMLLPRLHKHAPGKSYLPEAKGGLSIAGYPLFSLKTCLKAVAPPVAGQSESARIAWLHVPFLQKNISVTADQPPGALARFDTTQAVSASGELAFNLDKVDTVFSYELAGNDKTSTCSASGTSLSCSLEPLALAQGAKYELTLQRLFGGESQDEVLKTSVKTLDPVVITGSSIKQGETVYDAPTALILTTNKNLVSTDGVGLYRAGTDEQIPGTTAAFSGTTLNISFAEPLPRETGLELRIAQAEAEDGSNLTNPYVLSFTTSGGPKVAGVSIGTSRVSPDANVVLTFDVGLQPGQNFVSAARLEVGGQAVPAAVTLQGNRLVINPSSSLPRCTSFSVKVSAGLVNQYGIGGGQAWQLNSRTLCQVVFSIGRSVQGRSITAYRFGSGPSRIVLVGGMHGNERSSVATMNALVSYLEDRGHEIPGNRSIIVVPNSNPDGYARNSRTNANNVDLNRNFPANDWQSSVQMPGGITSPTGGGNSAGDQPETQALMSFINSQNPRLVLTYHAVARVVISNDAGDSIALGQKYAADSRYRFTSDGGSDDEFGYATTGEFEDWLADARGTPAILIELGTMSSNEFSTHRTALWNIVNLP